MERGRGDHDPDAGATAYRGLSEAPAGEPRERGRGRSARRGKASVNPRRAWTLDTVRGQGLLDGETARIGARIPASLIAAAKRQSGIRSDAELPEYALAQVALEDDFGLKLLARKGTIDPDLDLGFDF
jgi:hypothetical protein